MVKHRALEMTDFMPFGKHKGQQVEDVMHDDPEYVSWLIDNDVMGFSEMVMQKAEDMKII